METILQGAERRASEKVQLYRDILGDEQAIIVALREDDCVLAAEVLTLRKRNMELRRYAALRLLGMEDGIEPKSGGRIVAVSVALVVGFLAGWVLT